MSVSFKTRMKWITGADERRHKLSVRERQVLVGIARGEKLKDTARNLGIAVKTLDHYRASLRAKTGRHSIAALTLLAAKLGLVEIE